MMSSTVWLNLITQLKGWFVFQLPQCLCIHLQRLTWSNEGTPIKRQEHVHFTEFLSMDRYKHNAAVRRMQRTKWPPVSTDTETQQDLLDKPTPNGPGRPASFV